MHKNIKVGVIENKGPNSLRGFLCNIKNSNCKSLDIAVAFITKEGVDAIRPLLSSVAKKCKVRILTGIYQSFTQPSALKELNKINRQTNGNLELRISKNKRFHWKAYFIIKKTNADVVIGSSNLTSDGLGAEGEINLQLNLGTNSSSFKNIYKSFVNEWENNSLFADEKSIRKYESECKEQNGQRIYNSFTPSKIFITDKAVKNLFTPSQVLVNYWRNCISGTFKSKTEVILEKYTNWDKKGWNVISSYSAKKWSNNDLVILFDHVSQIAKIVKIEAITVLPEETPDGKIFAAYSVVKKYKQKKLTKPFKESLKKAGVVKYYSDLNFSGKLSKEKFNIFQEFFKSKPK